MFTEIEKQEFKKMQLKYYDVSVRWKDLRCGTDSNCRIKVLQTFPLSHLGTTPKSIFNFQCTIINYFKLIKQGVK